MPNFGSGEIDVWTKGTYVSLVADISKLQNATNEWAIWEYLTWKETNTSNDESERYVRVNFRESGYQTGYLLGDGIAGTDIGNGYKQIYLPNIVSDLSSQAPPHSTNMEIVFSLFQLKGDTPIVSDITLTGKWNPSEADQPWQ